ncbi:MAG: HAD-IA family hydrolase [Eubacteriales bacterium]|nr:HAD-IA family hydrolase [Eubacteriales bacterium]
MKNIRTILFDFDGTIMNTNDLIIQSWQHTFRTVEGKERPVGDIVRTFGEPLWITMEKQLPQLTPDEGITIYRSYLRQHLADMIYPFPGMVELIKKLKEQKYLTGLVTSRTKDTTYECMNRFDIASYFDCIVSCDDTDKHKPDPEPLFIALEKLSAKPQESIMVGDSMFDILCAKNAGVQSILVGWQMTLSREEINGPEGPDFTIEKPEDLLDMLTA